MTTGFTAPACGAAAFSSEKGNTASRIRQRPRPLTFEHRESVRQRNELAPADVVKAYAIEANQKGGTLLTFANARDLPIRRFSLPLRNIVAGVPSKQFWSPGSTLKVTFNNTNPLVYGMPREGLALFMAGGQVYEVTSTERSKDVEILSAYAERDLLQSGWLLGEQVIAKMAAAVSVKHGAGKVVLIGLRPQHRDQTHGTFKMVFNALLNSPTSATPTTTTAQQ
jgi:hypothetical protein